MRGSRSDLAGRDGGGDEAADLFRGDRVRLRGDDDGEAVDRGERGARLVVVGAEGLDDRDHPGGRERPDREQLGPARRGDAQLDGGQKFAATGVEQLLEEVAACVDDRRVPALGGRDEREQAGVEASVR